MVTDYAEGELFQILEDDGSLPEEQVTNEPHSKKTCLQGFPPCPTQTGLYSHRRWKEAGNFRFRK